MLVVRSSGIAFLLLTTFAAICQTTVQPGQMKKVAEDDPRFLSYNVETVEVTGGRFWKPYSAKAEAPAAAANTNMPAGIDPSMFQYRAPIDLSQAKLRKLAGALAPAYMRVSGTWRNSSYFQNTDDPAPKTPPKGYQAVLTRAQWKGVVDFSHAVGAELVTSVATSAGTRDANGVWTPAEAAGFFEYTKSVGGHIAATEFMNEPTYASLGGAPEGYSGADFGRDVKAFRGFLKKASPGTLMLGPGSIGEAVVMAGGATAGGPKLSPTTPEMMQATGPIFDGFSYHFYSDASQRCTRMLGPKYMNTPATAMTTAWFDRNMQALNYYAADRDKYLPGKPMWLTETGEAACGGDPFAAQFVDVFRFMDQLGSLSAKGVRSVMVNTLASSDYGMLDEETYAPRPDFWAAVLWKRTMGERVLDPGVSLSGKARVYAACERDHKGGVTLLVINFDNAAEQTLVLPVAGERYTLSSPELTSKQTMLNGTELTAGEDGSLPTMAGAKVAAGKVGFAPLTVSFVTLPGAKNAVCR